VANVSSELVAPPPTQWQASLWAPSRAERGELELDSARRTELGRGAWIDHLPGWVTDPDALFEALLHGAPWRTRVVTMYGSLLPEPRLVSGFDGPTDPRLPSVVPRMAAALGVRYERDFDRVHAALYRDGRDSVAWHGDRVPRELHEPIVAIVSLGSPRRFLVRPARGRSPAPDWTQEGGASIAFTPHAGDLLVLGGTIQRTWQHSVPKCKHTGPRISLMLRHFDDTSPAEPGGASGSTE
jgi:alkylated DNA repair dioxygenase AlkB